MRICDSETGDYLHLPFDGGMMDQPYWTMMVLDLIRLNYRIYTADKRKEEMQKMQAKQKRPKRGL